MLKKTLIVSAIALTTAAPAFADPGLTFDGWLQADYYSSGNTTIGGQLNASYGYNVGNGELGVALTIEGTDNGWGNFFPHVYYQFGNTRISYGYIEASFDYVYPRMAWSTDLWEGFMWASDSYTVARIDTTFGNTELSASYNEYGDASLAFMSHFGAIEAFGGIELWGNQYYFVGIRGGAADSMVSSPSAGSFGMGGLGYTAVLQGRDDGLRHLDVQLDYNVTNRFVASIWAESHLHNSFSDIDYVLSGRYDLADNLAVTGSVDDGGNFVLSLLAEF